MASTQSKIPSSILSARSSPQRRLPRRTREPRKRSSQPMTPDALIPAADVAKRLGVSQAAVDLVRSSDAIDLHIDSFIAWRLVRYDFRERHKAGPFGRHLWGHSDLPRLIEGGYTGAMWSITTNPMRSAASRWKTFERNLTQFRKMVDETNGAMRLVRTVKEYRAAGAAGAHAVFVAIQGGHALNAAPNGVASVPDRLLTRVTLVHLLSSSWGV